MHTYMSIDIYLILATKPCFYVSKSVVSLILPDLYYTIAYKQKLQNAKCVLRILESYIQQASN